MQRISVGVERLGLLHDLRDPENDRSISRHLRGRRFAFFRKLIEPLPKPVRILDVGGTQDFWEGMDYVDPERASITVFNLMASVSRHSNITTASGSACDMSMFEDAQFDVVFSNSVIEHVGSRDDQQAMAREIQRVGERYFVQTPNLYFPIEPHFMFPYFQFLPLGAKVWLLMHFPLSWSGRFSDRGRAIKMANWVNLLDRGDFAAMFPGAQLYEEKVFGLTKSFVAYDGW